MSARYQGYLRALGVPGIIGIGVLVACIPFYFSAVVPAEREIRLLRQQALLAQPRVPPQAEMEDRRRSELLDFYARFPLQQQLPDQLERVYTLAREAELELASGDYQYERPASGLAAYHLTVSAAGTYARIRQFVDSILVQMPMTSLDTLSFERRSSTDSRIEARLRLTIYFRTE